MIFIEWEHSHKTFAKQFSNKNKSNSQETNVVIEFELCSYTNFQFFILPKLVHLMKMWSKSLAVCIILAVFAHNGNALFEDQVGKFDW